MKKSLFLFFVGALVAPTSFAHAVAVGLSPSVMELVMHEGQVAEVTYSVSRSEVEGEFSLDVTAIDENGIVSLSNGTVVTIPEGKNSKPFSFTIDTTGIEPGQYKASISFQEQQPKNSGEVLSIRYGLQGSVDLSVVSEGEYNQLLLENPVKLNRLFVDSEVVATGKSIPVSYEITNPGPLFIDKISHVIEVISPEGEVIEQVEYTDTVNLAPFQNVIFEKLITIDTAGEYTLRVRALNNGEEIVESGTDIVVEEQLEAQRKGVELAIVILAAVVMILVLVAFGKKKK